MGDETFSKIETARDKKSGWLPGTTAKGTTWVFLIALHISKAALKFYNFDNAGLKKKYLAQHFYSIIQSDPQHTFSVLMYAK